MEKHYLLPQLFLLVFWKLRTHQPTNHNCKTPTIHHNQPTNHQTEVKAKGAPPPRDPITCARGLSKVPIYHLPTPSLPWWDLRSSTSRQISRLPGRRQKSFQPQIGTEQKPHGFFVPMEFMCFFQVSYVLHLPLQLWEITMEPRKKW